MKTILVILCVILLALQYRLWFAEDGVIKTFHLRHEIEEQQAKNQETIQKNAILTKEINALKQGGAAIENRARNDLGMVKKGEVFYQIIK